MPEKTACLTRALDAGSSPSRAASPAATSRIFSGRTASTAACAGGRQRPGRAAGAEARAVANRAAGLDRALDEVGVAQEAGGETRARAPRRSRPGAPTWTSRPSLMMAMRSASVSASSWSWVTKIVGDADLALDLLQLDLHLLAQVLVERARAARRAAAPSGSVTRARASATRCCWPPESCVRPALLQAGQAAPVPACRPTRSAISAAADAAHRQAEGDVVEDASCGGTARSSGTPCRCSRRCAGMLRPRRRRSVISPLSGSTKPATARSRVVLPLPLGPSRA